MTRGFLFGGNANNQNQSKYLVEFKAGKMSQKGKMVHPDKRQGMVYVHQSEDSLMHFCWKDRTSGAVEEDLIIFPDDVEFKRVPECTTGRVYVLKFKSSSRRCFYWMQEPKAEKDQELVRKVNEFLNNPPSRAPSSDLQAELSNIGDENLQNLLNNMSQHQLVQLLGGIGGSNLSSLLGRGSSTSISGARRTTETLPPSSTTTQESEPSIQLSDLQSILSGIKVPSSEQMGGDANKEQPVNVDLSTALNAEAVLQPLLSNRELMSRVEALLPPQALSMFSSALQSGQLGPLMAQFGMDATVVDAANSGDMEAFVKALQSSKSDEKPKDEDEDMGLD
ncbi:proteasomal ubiquitin receptor ADRM1-like isoform X2 [Ornithodoros turicata]|uniref:proteasomal ubiquitin receptor ADRM1-like isoform X2 n=1 Tax=Ornithodoros turicata TaxID=34597 RepID=UPI003139169C